MKQHKIKDIEDLLHGAEAPEPPRGLLEAIQAEIPDEFSATERPATGHSATRPAGRPFRRDRSFLRDKRWLAAASVVVALGAGFLGLRTVRQMEQPASESARVPHSAEEKEKAARELMAGEESAASAAAVAPSLTSPSPASPSPASPSPDGRDALLDGKNEVGQSGQAARDRRQSDALKRDLDEVAARLDAESDAELKSLGYVSPEPTRPAANKVPITDPTPAEPMAVGERESSLLLQDSQPIEAKRKQDAFFESQAKSQDAPAAGRQSGAVSRRAEEGTASKDEMRYRAGSPRIANEAEPVPAPPPARGLEEPEDARRKLQDPEIPKPAAALSTGGTANQSSTTSASTVTDAELKKVPSARDPWESLKPVPEKLSDGGKPSDNTVSQGQADTSASWPVDSVVITDSEARGASPSANPPAAAPSTGGTAEPNDQPYGDVFHQSYGVNPFLDTEDDPLSTFALDVDTGSYTQVRRYLRDGHLPPAGAVRVEEMVNYFDYGDRAPGAGQDALAITLEGGTTPFVEGSRYRLLRVGIQGREAQAGRRDPALLIFAIDVSGSMERENRLGLVKQALGLLLDQLGADDRVGLVVYGSRGAVLLEPTGDLAAIRHAIDRLQPGGSTNAEEGLVLAYELAERYLRPGAINRVILCSDGVANVGATGPSSILARIGAATRRGIELTTVGFGMGNFNDVLMEQLADRGNGNYAYVDRLEEARRIFVENLTSTLQTLAFDAKVQVELDPRSVSRYRLLGYENRDVADRDFRNDAVDAGEIGVGHSVTALYELKLTEAAAAAADQGAPMHLATVRLRYRPVGSEKAVEKAQEIGTRDLARSWSKARKSLRLAAVVAEFAEILRGSYWAKDGDLQALLKEAQKVSAEYPGNPEVAELPALIAQAAKLQPRKTQQGDD